MIISHDARMTKILLTRPDHQAQKTAQFLASHGHETVIVPMLVLEKKTYAQPDYHKYKTLIITSANSFHFWDMTQVNRNTPLIVVGPQTKRTAQDQGFTNILNIDGTAKDIKAALGNDPALHIGGLHITQNFGHCVDRLIVYEAHTVNTMPDTCRAALQTKSIDLILLYSARTARTFSRLIKEEKLQKTLQNISVLSISEKVLDCVRVLPWKNTYTASEPNGSAMIEKCLDIKTKNKG